MTVTLDKKIIHIHWGVGAAIMIFTISTCLTGAYYGTKFLDKVDKIEGDQATIMRTDTALNNRVTINTNNISKLQADMATTKSDVATLQKLMGSYRPPQWFTERRSGTHYSLQPANN